MGYIYRYTDEKDGMIKYVGCIYKPGRTVKQRVDEHKRRDAWAQNSIYKVEFANIDILSRAEAESYETHYINLYGTGKWYNKEKTSWGDNRYLKEIPKEAWIEFKDYSEDELFERELILSSF